MKTPKRRQKPSADRWKIDVTKNIDLDHEGYAVARQLDAQVKEMGIKYLHLTPARVRRSDQGAGPQVTGRSHLLDGHDTHVGTHCLQSGVQS